MDYTVLDLNTYPRRAHFDYFRSLPYPYVGTTVELDVSDVVSFCGEHRCSFYLVFLHLAALAANGTPEFRRRIRDGGIVEYAQCPTSHTELCEDGSYCYCTLRHDMGLREYLEGTESARQACRNSGITEDEDVESMLFISTLPDVPYTALIQPVAGGDESNPRITWGQYRRDPRGRCLMPVTVLVHHALADGSHIALFYRNLKEAILRLPSL